MNLPSKEELFAQLKDERLSRRLIRDLRYVPEEIAQPEARDFLVVRTRSGNGGIILYNGSVHSFELQRRKPNAAGRVEAIICDVCASWQRGTNTAVLTLKKDSQRTISHLVCSDLECSLHVRSLTDASKLSRTQLREHIDQPARIDRLNERLKAILEAK